MEVLNARKYVNLFGSVSSEGRNLDYSPEELEECKERHRKLYEEESEMAKSLREGQALAATRPKVYLTF